MIQKDTLVIIAVIYNSYPETLQFIESIHRCIGSGINLILVDNSEISPDSFFTGKIKNHDFITYIKTDKNLGYFHGAEFGLMHFLGHDPHYPHWIMVCNVDIAFETPSFLENLTAFENYSDLGVIAPAIISTRWKKDLNPFCIHPVSLKKLEFLRFIYSNILLHNGYLLLHYGKRFVKLIFSQKSGNRRGDAKEMKRIYAPHGSCIIFNKKYFERGGTLHHISFLFGEEIFVGETTKRLDLNILYVPELLVRHYEHSSIGNFISSKINKFYKQSIEDIITTYYS
jgi:GT2 family glycosyltransferase